MGYINVWSYIQWVTFVATYANCLITHKGVKIQWIANGHCNSKYKLQA
jgi:hypothetical protein